MEIHGAERFATTSSFPSDAAHHSQVDRQNFSHGGFHHHHHRDPRHHPNFNGEQNESNGPNFNHISNPPPLSGQKRQFHHTNGVDNGGFVKLYVVGIPRDATEQDVASVFGEYGEIIEVVLIKDKRTGIQQEYCFVKYATIEQAERAIGAFQSQYKFPGALIPMKVKYADRERERERERERIGSNVHLHKLYVGCVSKQALRWEIEEIFSPFGVLEDVFVVRDEFKQNRGFAFVQFSCRDMAVAAIQALNGTFVMRGCDQPLIVRFAEPKKPRVGDSRPAPYPNDPSNGHVISNETKQMKNTPTGCKTTLTACNGPTSHSIAEMENSIECDWSEHVSPDGELYYYNCTTCESRWEKPVEYAIYEQELDYLEDKLQLQQESKLENLSFIKNSVAQKV